MPAQNQTEKVYYWRPNLLMQISRGRYGNYELAVSPTWSARHFGEEIPDPNSDNTPPHPDDATRNARRPATRRAPAARVPAPRRVASPPMHNGGDMNWNWIRNSAVSILAIIVIGVAAWSFVFGDPVDARAWKWFSDRISPMVASNADDNAGDTDNSNNDGTDTINNAHTGTFNGRLAMFDGNDKFVGYILADGTVSPNLPDADNSDTDGDNDNNNGADQDNDNNTDNDGTGANGDEDVIGDDNNDENITIPCRADKVATFPESTDTERLRQEIGGGGQQHSDFYTDHGVKAVSYVVSPREPMIWFGHGSLWEWNGDECASYDYQADAVNYATGNGGQPGRLDNGHSGIAVVLDSCQLFNTQKWSKDDVQSLLNAHGSAMVSFPCMTLTGDDGNTYTMRAGAKEFAGAASMPGEDNTPKSPDEATCQSGAKEDHPPAKSAYWTPKGQDGWRAVNVWSNKKGVKQDLYKILIAPGDNFAVQGGGDSTYWPAECSDAAQAGFESNGNPPITIEGLRKMGIGVKN